MRALPLLLSLLLSSGCMALHDRRLGEQAAAQEDWPAAYAAWARLAAAHPGSARAQQGLQTVRTALLAQHDAALERALAERRLREAGRILREADAWAPPPAWTAAHADRIAQATGQHAADLRRDARFAEAAALLAEVGASHPRLPERLQAARQENTAAWADHLRREADAAIQRGALATGYALLEGAARLETSPSHTQTQRTVWSRLLPTLWGGTTLSVQGPAPHAQALRADLAGRWGRSPWREAPVLERPPSGPTPYLAVDLQLTELACQQVRTGTEQRIHRYADGTFISNPALPALQKALREAEVAQATALRAHADAAQRAEAAHAALQRVVSARQAQDAEAARTQADLQAQEAARQAALEQATASREASTALRAREAEVRALLQQQEAHVRALTHLERVVLPPLTAAREAAAATHAARAEEARQATARADEARRQEAAAAQQAQQTEAALTAARAALERHTAEQAHLRQELAALQQRAAQTRDAARDTAATLAHAEEAEGTAREALQAATELRKARQEKLIAARGALQKVRRERAASGLTPEQIAALDAQIAERAAAVDAAEAALQEVLGGVQRAEVQHRGTLEARDAARDRHQQAQTAEAQARTALQQAEAALQSGPATGQQRQAEVAAAERALREARDAHSRAQAALQQAAQAERLAQERLRPAEQALQDAQAAEAVQRDRLKAGTQESEDIARRLRQLEAELGALVPSVELLAAREAALVAASQRQEAAAVRHRRAQAQQAELHAQEAQARQAAEDRQREAGLRAIELQGREDRLRGLRTEVAQAPPTVERIREQPYTVEQWERTCTAAATAALRGGPGGSGSDWSDAVTRTSRDESHPAFPPGGLAADPRTYAEPDAAVLEALRAELGSRAWSAVEAQVQHSARTSLELAPTEADLEAQTADYLRVLWLAPALGQGPWEQHLTAGLGLPPAP